MLKRSLLKNSYAGIFITLFLLLAGTCIVEYPLTLTPRYVTPKNFTADSSKLPSYLTSCKNDPIKYSKKFFIIWKDYKAMRFYDVCFVTLDVISAKFMSQNCTYKNGSYNFSSLYEVVSILRADNRFGKTLFSLQAKQFVLYTRKNETDLGIHCDVFPLSTVSINKNSLWTGKLSDEKIFFYSHGFGSITNATGTFYNKLTKKTFTLSAESDSSCTGAFDGWGRINDEKFFHK